MVSLGNLFNMLTRKVYRWNEISFNPNMARRSGRLKGMSKSIYHKWGFDNDAYHVHLSKQERAGKTWQEKQAMRMKIWKNRRKAI